jgi:aminoglycoside phosphotransferase (APT) family kinase protein
MMEFNERTPMQRIRAVAPAFLLEGRLTDARRHGNGRIHETLVATFEENGVCVRYIFQRINSYVFRDVPRMMENIRRVTAHLARVRSDRPDQKRQLSLVSARDGNVFYRDESGEFWRVYPFIEGTLTHEKINRPEQACQAARAFGEFVRDLSTLPPPPLYETIPGFHDTAMRFANLETAIEADRFSRARACRQAIDFAGDRRWIASSIQDLIQSGSIPVRATHNDTKINNVLFDSKSGRGVAVVDLDTVMPGTWLHDFGDMVRSAANPAAEDDRDLARITLRPDLFEAIARGYATAVGAMWNEAEWANLVFSARVIAYELGMRFLTDHLEGDRYFKASHPGHNLERCLVQFELVRRLEESEAELQGIVSRIRDEFCGS